MKTTLRALGLLLGLAVLAVAGFVAFVAARGIPRYAPPRPPVAHILATPERLAQGEKLVLAACADCHRNRATGALSGQLLRNVTPDFGQVFAANITQDRTHGIGAWTDAELVGLLRTGIGRDGRYRLIMPSFGQMSDEDVASAVAFLRADNALTRADPTPSHPQQPSLLLMVLANTVMKPTPLPTGPVGAPAPTEAVAFGRYLVVGRYKCYECHSHDFKTNNALEPEKSAGYLGGGNKLLNAHGQEVVSRNITGDAATGIGRWNEAQLAQSLRFGRGPNGPLGAPMPQYAQLTDAEVHALYDYLQAVPKLKNATPEDGALAAK
ncbi:MAG: c-type cytochrome [Janthinobacterium lividum]